jgi:hypothetical protein
MDWSRDRDSFIRAGRIFSNDQQCSPRRIDCYARSRSKSERGLLAETLSQRLLHYIGEKRRDQLMIIYLEDLKGLGLTAADVAKGGMAEAKWNEIADALLERARKDLQIKALPVAKH